MRTASELDRISREIIGGAIAIHRALGPGCFESAYQPCLEYELLKRGLQFQAKTPLTLRYGEVVIPRAYEADLIVERRVIVEVKAIAQLAPIHVRQLQTYLRLSGCPLGLILNFGELTLVDGVRRMVNSFPEDRHSGLGITPSAPPISGT